MPGECCPPVGGEAEFDAWYVFGVDQVVNLLEVHASTEGRAPCH
jgi:hypothetical protein